MGKEKGEGRKKIKEGRMNVDLLERPVLKWIVGQILSGGERLVNKQQVYRHTCLQTTDNKQQVYRHTCLQTTNNKYTATLVYKQLADNKQQVYRHTRLQTTNNKYTGTLVYKQQTTSIRPHSFTNN